MQKTAPAMPGRFTRSKKWHSHFFEKNCTQGEPRFLTEKSARLAREVSFSTRMSPKMTKFHFIPSPSGDGTPCRRAFLLLNYSSSKIVPLVPMVTTCQGIILPLAWRAFFTASSMPPQQGTSIRTTVTLFTSLRIRISVSFSL